MCEEVWGNITDDKRAVRGEVYFQTPGLSCTASTASTVGRRCSRSGSGCGIDGAQRWEAGMELLEAQAPFAMRTTDHGVIACASHDHMRKCRQEAP